jgi:uncharacterized RDD family membrane protein YckC
MSWADSVRIETPEQIDLDLDIAGPGSRFYAQLLDWVFKGLILLVLLIFFIVATPWLVASLDSKAPNYYLAALCLAIAFVVVFVYDIYFEGCRNGQTPGKYLAKLRVVRDGGGPIDVQAACIRNLVGLADMLPAFYLLGGTVAMLHKRGQRLGDMAAGTVVIRVRATEAPDDLEPRILKLAGDEFQFQAEHLARCKPEDLNVLRSFFARQGQMDPARRHGLATKLRWVFLERTGYTPPVPEWDEGRTLAFLAALYRDLQTVRAHA